MDDKYDYLFKIILVGDAAVGKTSIVRKFTTGKFQAEYKSTIGVDFTVQTLQLDGRLVKLQIWDTTGQERFRSLTTGYYRNANAAMVVYDVTSTESLLNCKRWMDDVNMYSGRNDVPKLLLGNKSDMLSGRTVSSSDGERFARQYNMMGFIETSAKDGRNIDTGFYTLAQFYMLVLTLCVVVCERSIISVLNWTYVFYGAIQGIFRLYRLPI